MDIISIKVVLNGYELNAMWDHINIDEIKINYLYLNELK